MFRHGPRFTSFFAALCFLLAVASSSAQTTIHVPADQPSIQAGIDAAHDGDTVFVSPGTYNENIDFKGKAITVTSGATRYADAATTIIQAPNAGPAVVFQHRETRASVLNGFTVTHLQPIQGQLLGDGIAMASASATISNNMVRENLSCAVSAVSSPAFSMLGNYITGQAAQIATPCSVPNVVHQHMLQVSPVFVIDSGEALIDSNLIENSEADGLLSTVLVGYTDKLTLKNNTIRGNNGASALGIEDVHSIDIVQNLLYGNATYFPVRLEHHGSQFAPAFPVTLTVTNNTFSNPSSKPYTGVQLLIESEVTSGTLANNILFDPVDVAPALDCGYPLVASTIIENNDVASLGMQSYISTCQAQNTANVSLDPLFIDPAQGNYRLQVASPVINAGDINAPLLPPADLDGKNRTVCGKIDMGVYQHHPHPPIALAAAPNPTPGRSAVTLTAALTGNCNTPTGTVTFFDGATVLGTAALGPGAVASFTTSFLFVGTHTLTAHYPGDFNFEDSTSNAVTEVITGPPTTTVLTTVAPNPALPFQAVTMTATVSSAYTVPAGTVTFFAGQTPLATVPVAANGGASTVASTLGAGTYAITARYSGSTEYAGSTSNAVTLVVLPAPSATTLTAQPNPVYQGQTVTFTASTAGTGPGPTAATGTISFFDGGTLLGAVALTSGHATFATNTLAVGSHTITASYSGEANFAPSTSSAVVEVVLASSFSIRLAPASLSFLTGQTQQVAVTLTSIGNYAGTLQLGIGALPLYASASFRPASVTLTAGGASTATLTLLTAAPPVRAGVAGEASGIRIALAALAALPLLLLRRRARRLPNLLAVLLAVTALAGLSGCGYARSVVDSVAPGTYIIPVTATDSQSHTTQTAHLTLEVGR